LRRSDPGGLAARMSNSGATWAPADRPAMRKNSALAAGACVEVRAAGSSDDFNFRLLPTARSID